MGAVILLYFNLRYYLIAHLLYYIIIVFLLQTFLVWKSSFVRINKVYQSLSAMQAHFKCLYHFTNEKPYQTL
jgi:cobalamin biosynthesis protein CobD/CbiB